ncbi:High-affinity branched-chain amino acid transport system permease protein LivH [Caulifigura coniformis]|uniref:High-affinity branched-chain amino acid transport system permease protein LivH n=1 Tax=Caulifigura coniformis TaxID=2527983 RepID=A0A517SGS4_9PLAN|nr:branched-chain amino acid ABC transporter permease [Caulifigura coniformis]QDT55326.1 High-affinity branched-chain amino acid transport system permease protein LivH [Caulifigura coniformis]
MADFVQTLVTSLSVGSLYALIALGYTMVYGILRFINFAHGDIVVLGAWTSFTFATLMRKHVLSGPEIPWWLGPVVLVASMIVCGGVGYLIERFAYRPLRTGKIPLLSRFLPARRVRPGSGINVLITAIGVSLLLQNVGQLKFVFGASPQRMPDLIPYYEVLKLTFAGDPPQSVVIGLVDVIILCASAVLMLVLEGVVFRTKLGTAMRAVSFNTETAALMGIPVDRVISATFVAGSMLAAAAGFLIAMKYPGLNQPAHTIWVLLGLKAFVAAVIGGIGNIRGAMLGGFIIAFVEQFGSYYVSSAYRDVYVFVLLILILLVKPNGILGKAVREKV